jgi:hypothetical protein
MSVLALSSGWERVMSPGSVLLVCLNLSSPERLTGVLHGQVCSVPSRHKDRVVLITATICQLILCCKTRVHSRDWCLPSTFTYHLPGLSMMVKQSCTQRDGTLKGAKWNKGSPSQKNVSLYGRNNCFLSAEFVIAAIFMMTE